MIKEKLEPFTKIVFEEKNNFDFRPEALILIYGFLLCIVGWLTIDGLNLFGHKSTSIFDIWSIVHICTGAVLSFIIIGFRKFDIHHPIILLLLISSTWEIIEHYIETVGVVGLSVWFGGQESIFNRLIADQLSLVLGFTIIKYKPNLFWYTLLISLSILILHIYLGDSMYFFR